MNSPLSMYKEVAKEFGITEDKQVRPRQKIAFAEAQVQEQRAIINRLIADTARARTDMEKARDATLKAAYAKKMAGYEDDLRQMATNLNFSIEFERELRDEFKEVGEVSPVDHPEGA